jgi:MFS family permease
MTFSVVNKNTGRPAAASAVVQAGIFVGAGIAPLIFGFLAERASFRIAWLFVAVGLAAAVVLIELVRRRVALPVQSPT